VNRHTTNQQPAQPPEIGNRVTVTTRDGRRVTGPLTRTYNGIRPNSLRGEVQTGPGPKDFDAGFIGLYEPD